MALRYAERQKAFHKLGLRNYPTRLLSARLTSSDRAHEIDFAPGITVFSGGNGAGKSTTLGAVWRCLSGLNYDSIRATSTNPPHWLSAIEIRGVHEGTNWAATYSPENATFDGECPANVQYIDASAETGYILSLIQDDDNPRDLIEGIDPTSLNQNYVDLLSYVLKREYDAVKVYEITAFSEEDDPTPFFEVTSMGVTYTSTSMGRGELSAAYLIWRLSNLENGSIALIEEPESHLASFSQKALAEVVAHLTVAHGLTLIISSHSPGFLRPIPSKHVVLLNSSPVPTFRDGLTSHEISTRLGLTASRDGLLITEDKVASYLLREVLAAAAPEILSKVSIRYADSGESGVTRAIDDIRCATGPDGFTVLGVLDGDQKPAEASDGTYGYLMGDVAPDLLMKQMSVRWRSGEFEDWEPRFTEKTQLQMALESLDGEDHHDWVTELAKQFDGYGPVIKALTQLCLRDAQLASESDALIDWIRSKLT